ncbi:hypothetical protein [Pseudofrankia sp. BMG5.36]|uniref:hypothetical protein n=1 Tax=Pseudofrankia sp. BMG5.36 TaxID=1834512 RepID=UPI0008D92FE7|nr:hypothetical protein [Pseudofrankia sp. BMG5.36]OHV49361.1 hypothetical protein BCD48_13020 [Pseudofrankia sp. BMG5.36]
MARGRNQGAAAQPKAPAKPKTATAKSAPTAKSVPTVKSVPTTGPKKVKGTKPEHQPDDLKAALPYFLIRIAVFAVITVILILVGFYVLWALLIGMIAASVVTWPIARIQKRVARRDTAGPGKPAK